MKEYNLSAMLKASMVKDWLDLLQANVFIRITGLRCDQIIRLTGIKSSQLYSAKLKHIKYYDANNKKYLVFPSNQFEVSALIIAELYPDRWKIERFFKRIIQHLKIKAFFGTSTNAVKTQVWTVINAHVLAGIIKRRLNIGLAPHTIPRIFSMSLFEKALIDQFLTETKSLSTLTYSFRQLRLWDFYRDASEVL